MRERARNLRKNPTEAERFLWQHIRRRQLGGFRFRRQYAIGLYIVDFYCLEERVAIEVDGGQHNGQAAYDAERTCFSNPKEFAFSDSGTIDSWERSKPSNT